MRRRSVRETRRISGPNSTFSKAVRQGNKAYSWNTTPRSAEAPRTGAPSTSTRPAVGCTKPAIIPSKVDLPQPDGPSRQVKLFSARSRLTRASAVRPLSNVFETLSIRIFVRMPRAGEIWSSTLPPRRLAPTQKPSLQEAQEPVESETDQSDHRRAQQHLGDQEECPGVVDEVAQTA